MVPAVAGAAVGRADVRRRLLHRLLPHRRQLLSNTGSEAVQSVSQRRYFCVFKQFISHFCIKLLIGAETTLALRADPDGVALLQPRRVLPVRRFFALHRAPEDEEALRRHHQQRHG